MPFMCGCQIVFTLLNCLRDIVILKEGHGCSVEQYAFLFTDIRTHLFNSFKSVCCMTCFVASNFESGKEALWTRVDDVEVKL